MHDAQRRNGLFSFLPMRIQDKKLFMFDLDGTLVDAYRAIAESLNFARKNFGHPDIPFETVKRNVGHGDRNFVAEFFPADEVDAALAVYRSRHTLSLTKYVQLKPYARLLLFRLKQRKKLVAIASNRPRPYTDIILKALDMNKYFDDVLCADEINALKPDPKILYTLLSRFRLSRAQAIFAGDMDVDMETARRAAVDALFVTGGSCSIKDIADYKPVRIVRSLKDILSYP